MDIRNGSLLNNKPLNFIGDEQFLWLWFVDNFKIEAAGPNHAVLPNPLISYLTLVMQGFNKSQRIFLKKFY